jgi:hypothetical protein
MASLCATNGVIRTSHIRAQIGFRNAKERWMPNKPRPLVGNALRARTSIVLPALVGALIISGAQTAHADEQEHPALAALERISAEGISAETKVLDDLADVSVSTTGEEAITSTANDIRVVVPQDPAEGISLQSEASGEGFTIGLPFSSAATDANAIDGGVVAYDNLNDSTTVPLVKDDGSVQITTVIDSPSAPTRYEYDLSLPAGSTVSLAETGEVVITGSAGEFIGGIAAAWAYDADGTAVPTHYELAGYTLTQVVAHNESYVYPVVADPWAGQNLLSWAGVSYYSGYYAVDAQATAWGRTWNGLATHASHVTELKYKLGGNAWRVDTNGGTIREQFLCHVAGNYFEQGTYNMESNRPAVYWPNQLNPWDRCNP